MDLMQLFLQTSCPMLTAYHFIIKIFLHLFFMHQLGGPAVMWLQAHKEQLSNSVISIQHTAWLIKDKSLNLMSSTQFLAVAKPCSPALTITISLLLLLFPSSFIWPLNMVNSQGFGNCSAQAHRAGCAAGRERSYQGTAGTKTAGNHTCGQLWTLNVREEGGIKHHCKANSEKDFFSLPCPPFTKSSIQNK